LAQASSLCGKALCRDLRLQPAGTWWQLLRCCRLGRCTAPSPHFTVVLKGRKIRKELSSHLAWGTRRSFTANRHIKVQRSMWQIPFAFKKPSQYAPNQQWTRGVRDLLKKHCKKPDPKQRAEKTSVPNYSSRKQCANGTGLHLRSCWSKNTKANQFEVDIVYCELLSQLFYI